MAKKTKVAAAGAGAYGSARAAAENPYVQRLVEDEDLRSDLRSAYDSARKAYSRINGKGPVRAITEDRKVQKELRSAADTLRGGSKRKRGGMRKLLMLAIVGGAAALALNEGMRKKVLDTLFGAEEEFEYTSTTTPAASGTPTTTSS
jgi:plasmid stabilization system protein ParE